MLYEFMIVALVIYRTAKSQPQCVCKRTRFCRHFDIYLNRAMITQPIHTKENIRVEIFSPILVRLP